MHECMDKQARRENVGGARGGRAPGIYTGRTLYIIIYQLLIHIIYLTFIIIFIIPHYF